MGDTSLPHFMHGVLTELVMYCTIKPNSVCKVQVQILADILTSDILIIITKLIDTTDLL